MIGLTLMEYPVSEAIAGTHCIGITMHCTFQSIEGNSRGLRQDKDEEAQWENTDVF